MPGLQSIDDSQIKSAQAHHIGAGESRTTQEDTCDAVLVRLDDGALLYVGMVADGMGGVEAGEIASKVAVRSTLSALERGRLSDLPMLLRVALEVAQARVTATRREMKLDHMGTTATLAAITPDSRLHLAHVGDSRAYLVRKGMIRQLTRDHTWGEEQVRAGKMTREEASAHERRDALARYIGMHDKLEVDLGLWLRGDESDEAAAANLGFQLEPGDNIVLCSDGLIKLRPRKHEPFVSDGEIAAIVSRLSPRDAAKRLIELALQRQADDNISVVILTIGEEPVPAAEMPSNGLETLVSRPTVRIGRESIRAALANQQAQVSEHPQAETTQPPPLPDLSPWEALEPPPASVLPPDLLEIYEQLAGSDRLVEAPARAEVPPEKPAPAPPESPPVPESPEEESEAIPFIWDEISPEPAPVARKRRPARPLSVVRLLVYALVAAVTLAIGVVAVTFLLSRPAQPAAAPISPPMATPSDITVTAIEGTLTQLVGETDIKPIAAGSTLPEEGRVILQTREQSRAAIQLGNEGITLYIGPISEVWLEPGEGDRTRVTLNEGRLLVAVTGERSEPFDVHTPSDKPRASLEGTVMGVERIRQNFETGQPERFVVDCLDGPCVFHGEAGPSPLGLEVCASSGMRPDGLPGEPVSIQENRWKDVTRDPVLTALCERSLH